MNNYNRIAITYQKTNQKPDKLFSILPTVIKIGGDLSGKIVLDLGCGDGFFTRELATQGTKKVIGIDNSRKQLALAKKQPHKNIEYKFGDIFKSPTSKSDLILAPFVVNYATNLSQLRFLIESMYKNLTPTGKIIMVIDLPTGKDLKKFGAIKKVVGMEKDGAEIKIDLYNNNEFICTLHAQYFKLETVEKILTETGFKKIKRHKPIVSQKGLKAYGKQFWRNYTKSPELAYLTAIKQG